MLDILLNDDKDKENQNQGKDEYLSKMGDNTAFTTRQGADINQQPHHDSDLTAEALQQQHIEAKLAEAENRPLQETPNSHTYTTDLASLLPSQAAVTTTYDRSVTYTSTTTGERVDVRTAEDVNRQPPAEVAPQIQETHAEYSQARGTLPSPQTPGMERDRGAGMAMA